MTRQQKAPLLVTIPHSGEKVPSITPWLSELPETVLMCDVDRYVDVLYEPTLRELHIPFVKTLWHRYAVDLNRVPEDIDESSVEGSLNPQGMHARGFHWVMTTLKQPIMKKPMSQGQHQELIKLIYEPFHLSVREIYNEFKKNGHSNIYHLDVHSMPSVGTSMHKDPGQRRADIVVSDCLGKSCHRTFKDLIIAAYATAGFKVAYNWPYVGGRVTEQYGDPSRGQQVIQVELNRDLYMDEGSKKLKNSHADVQSKLSQALLYIYDNLK